MIIPGIFDNNLDEIYRKILLVENTAHTIQIDIADGEEVDGKTFLDIAALNDLKVISKFDLDIMAEKPLDFLKVKINNAIKASMLTDAEDYIDAFIARTKELGYKTGLSLRPKTKFETIEKYMDKIDYLQFFTIKPGGSGREFDLSVLDKIEDFRKKYPDFPLQVDGGIDKDYLPMVLRAGVNDAVMTSHIFNAENPLEALRLYMDLEKEY